MDEAEIRGITDKQLQSQLSQQINPDTNSHLIDKANLLSRMKDIEVSMAAEEMKWMSILHVSGIGGVDEQMKSQRTARFNEIGVQAANIQDQLTTIRLNRGAAVLVIKVEKDMKEIQPSLTRILLITPNNNNNNRENQQ